MRKYLEDVKAMHLRFGQPTRIGLRPLSSNEAAFRVSFLEEEQKELAEASNIVDVVDALVDIAYVALGTVHYLGRGGVRSPGRLPSRAAVYSCLMNCTLGLLFDDIGSIRKLYNSPTSSYTMLQANEVYDKCIRIATLAKHVGECLGFDWDSHWGEVHRANMAKELCSPIHPSSRGYVDGEDLVKPVGWKEPDHLSIINKVNVPTGVTA